MEKLNEQKTEEEIEKTFKILSNPNRLKIIQILSTNDDKEATVSEIAEKIKITQPATSQHLKILKISKIVKCYKRGNNTYYKVNTKTIKEKKECIDNLFHIILK